MFSSKRVLFYIALLILFSSLYLWLRPSVERGEVDASVLSFYRENYEENRRAFRDLGQRLKREQRASMQSLAVPSAVDQDLTIDILYVPPTEKPEKLLIIASGTHGIEAFAGSAIQRYFLEKILPDLDRRNLGLLAVHAVNPYGFKHWRRVSENNVDLNRNWAEDSTLFQSKNDGYDIVYDLLNPSGRVDLSSMDNRFFAIRSMIQIARHSLPALRQAILQGQYTHREGLFFGGQDFEPQRALLEPIFVSRAAPFRYVMLVDLHTGFGVRGQLHLFPDAIHDPTIRERLDQVFEGHRIDYGDTEGFYTTSGSFAEYMGRLLNDKAYLPMVFEYGTMNSQTTSGSIRSLHNMIIENQGYRFGFVSEADREEAKHLFREHYFPSSAIWRTAVIQRSDVLFRSVVPRFLSLSN